MEGDQQWIAITTARPEEAEGGAMNKTGEGRFVKSAAQQEVRPLVEQKLGE